MGQFVYGRSYRENPESIEIDPAELGVDQDRRLGYRQRLFHPIVYAAKLRIASGMVYSLAGLAVGPQNLTHLPQLIATTLWPRGYMRAVLFCPSNHPVMAISSTCNQTPTRRAIRWNSNTGMRTAPWSSGRQALQNAISRRLPETSLIAA